jgi:hypothetical protein
MGGICSTHLEMGNVYAVLVGNSQGRGQVAARLKVQDKTKHNLER